MLQFLPFVLGILSGSAAVKAARSRQAREGFNRARASLGKAGSQLREGFAGSGSSVRQATVSGLAALEQGSARLREKLEATEASEQAAPVAAEAGAPAVAAITPAARKPRVRKPATTDAAAPAKPKKPATAPKKDEA